ncbi:MAG: diaminopimelate decarboxylase, partial [Firmicutes bacterium]|nr:diaminopimelate decarboxylase [Bacillota bacterium]
MHLHGTSYVDDGGHLVIGGCRAVDLAKSFGTPLVVYDEVLIRERAGAYRDALVRVGARGRIAYASKAFACIAMCRLAQQEGLWLEVVSGGELHTALCADFPADRIVMHGNNKTPAELEAAVEAGIGLVVIDNFYEIELLGRILRARGQTQDVLLRVSPGVDAHTHAFVATGKQDSKFGFDLQSGQALLAARAVSADRALQLRGLHAHIGSQIFDFDGFRVAADRLAGLYREIEDVCGHQMDLANLGGGLGIRYTEEDTLPPIGVAVERVIAAGRAAFAEQGLPEPEWMLEPGRSLVAEAGTTLYTIGSRKDIAGVRT